MRLPVSVRQLGSFRAAVAGFEFGLCGVAAQPNSMSPAAAALRNRIVLAFIIPPAYGPHPTPTPMPRNSRLSVHRTAVGSQPGTGVGDLVPHPVLVRRPCVRPSGSRALETSHGLDVFGKREKIEGAKPREPQLAAGSQLRRVMAQRFQPAAHIQKPF